MDILNNATNIDNIKNKQDLKDKTIEDIKKDISEYKLSELKDEEIIIKVIDKYLTILKPTIDELNNLKYRVNEMDDTTLSRHEVMYYDTQQIYYDPGDNAIISNEYGNPELKKREVVDQDEDDDENDYLL